jgi:hypothetical protein
MAFSVSHDETIPANHTTFESQPGYVRNTKISLRERLQFGGVYFPSTHDELAGEHSYVRMANQSSAPTAVATKWMLYVTSSGLFVREPGGTSIQITSTSSISGSSFVTGDWIISTVTTAHSGWTNVSSTYSNKFMRINATPLTTGGADTHTHGAGSYAGPSHTHTVPASSTGWGAGSATSGKLTTGQDGGTSATTDRDTSASGTGAVTGTSASGDNVPAYVQVVIFQKD